MVATGYDVSTTDGMNEKGLVANLLWLVESGIRSSAAKAGPGHLTMGAVCAGQLRHRRRSGRGAAARAVLDRHRQGAGRDRQATLHLSLSDASGDSAIVEYIGGRQVIHHDRRYQVMTNSPIFEQQLALSSYWQQIGGTVMLPGTNRSADRFARASFYINAIPKSEARWWRWPACSA